MCKGAPADVLAMCDNASDVAAEVTARLDECAAAGVRCLAVAANHRDTDGGRDVDEGAGASEDGGRRNGDGGHDRDTEARLETGGSCASGVGGDSHSSGDGGNGWTLLGLLSFYDPPRTDAAATIACAAALGIRVVMVTGDDAPAAREMCRRVGLPVHVIGGTAHAPLHTPTLVRAAHSISRVARSPSCLVYPPCLFHQGSAVRARVLRSCARQVQLSSLPLCPTGA